MPIPPHNKEKNKLFKFNYQITSSDTVTAETEIMWNNQWSIRYWGQSINHDRCCPTVCQIYSFASITNWTDYKLIWNCFMHNSVIVIFTCQNEIMKQQLLTQAAGQWQLRWAIYSHFWYTNIVLSNYITPFTFKNYRVLS